MFSINRLPEIKKLSKYSHHSKLIEKLDFSIFQRYNRLCIFVLIYTFITLKISYSLYHFIIPLFWIVMDESRPDSLFSGIFWFSDFSRFLSFQKLFQLFSTETIPSWPEKNSDSRFDTLQQRGKDPKGLRGSGERYFIDETFLKEERETTRKWKKATRPVYLIWGKFSRIDRDLCIF